MLKSLHLVNFQKHEDLFIELTDRNVIQGQSDRGKSSILRALYWVCFNRPSGTDFRREGSDTVEVTVVTSKGNVITRGRSKKESYYILNGEKFTGIGTDVPDPVMRALPVSSLNFARQHDGMFLLSSSKPDASRYIFSLIGLEEMDKSLAVAESRRRKLNGEHSLLTEDLERKQVKFKQYKQVPEMVERVQILEKMDNKVTVLQKDIGKLRYVMDYIETIDKKLIPVSDVDAMLSVISEMLPIKRNIVQIQDILHKFASIKVTHTLEYVNSVEETLLSLESMQNSITILHNTINALRAEIGKIQGIALSIQRQKELLQETEREWKIQTKGICPICGGKL